MILEIDGKTYTKISLNELSMTHLAMLQRELVKADDDFTSCRSLADVQRARDELAAMTEEEQIGHPEVFFMAILGVWMAKAHAGEFVGLKRTGYEVDWSSIRELPEPSDYAPKAKAPAKKRPSPKGSARGGSAQHAKASHDKSPMTSEMSSTGKSST